MYGFRLAALLVVTIAQLAGLTEGCLHLQDPEGILAQPRAGHLNRQQFRKQAEQDQDLQEQADRARAEAQKELMKQREVPERPRS